ncbi:DUF3887 domain-containing protein [Eubacteriales bacterium OttesenSCG-928-K08]|nr:DUF3887 domain-containing protein [Eubacteriales bacterium OttesenSCG-928-K08]
MKKLTILFVVVLLIASVTGCSKDISSTDLGQELVALTKGAVQCVNEREYGGFRAYIREDLRPQFSDEVMQGVEEYISAAGDFIEFGQTKVVPQKSGDGEESYAVVLEVKYESKELIYTAALDSQKEITGFYVK